MTTDRPGALATTGSRALLIGTARHSSGSMLPDVPAATSSVRDLQSVLVQVCGLDQRNLYPLLDPASPQVVADVLTTVAAQATDMLLIYYVGHGLVDAANELHLATKATGDLHRGVAAYQALPYSVVATVIEHCRARSIVVVLDCCFANRAHGAIAGAVHLAQQQGIYLLAAADGDQSAWAVPGQPHTAFTGELIRILAEGDPAGPPMLDLDHVYRQLTRVLAERGMPRPRRQASDRADAVVLAANAAYRPVRGKDLPPRVPAPVGQTSPYRGLSSFGQEDAAYFFGRETVTAQLVERLGDTGRQPGPLLIIGPSGSGKSSLLRAGLLPELDRMDLSVRGRWRSLPLTPGPDPLGRLAVRLAEVGGTAVGAMRQLMVAEPGGAAQRVYEALRPAGGQPADTLAVIVDQFEELFTVCPDETQRRLFVGALAALCGPSSGGLIRVVLGVRADFYGHCAGYPELRVAVERPFVVNPMNPAELRAVIEKPAALAGLALDEGLTDVLLRDLGMAERSGDHQGGLLPLLSYALLATWQHREGNRLTLAGYHATGGIRGAIASTADNTYHRLDPTSRWVARRLLLRLVRVSVDTQHSRRPVSLAELVNDDDGSTGEVTRHVIDQLAAARLITLGRDTVEITHEALIRAWPRFRDWIDGDRASLLIHQQLGEDAANWEHRGRDPAFLYTDTRLSDARALVWHWTGSLTATEQAFLAASDRRERRGARRRRAVVAAMAVISVLALVAGAVAFWQREAADAQRGELERQRDIAISRQAATQVITVYRTDPGLAALLAQASYRVSPTLEARSALLSSTALPQVTRLLGHRGPVSAMALAPQGNLLVTGGEDGTVRLWNLAERREIALLEEGHRGRVSAVAFASGGRMLASAGFDGTIRLWDIADPRRAEPIGDPVDVGVPVRDLAAISSEAALVAVTDTGEITVWDVMAPVRLARIGEAIPGHEGAATAVAVAPGDAMVATGGRDKVVRLWALDGDRRLVPAGQPLTGHTGEVTSIAFGPDGQSVAAGGQDGTVRRWPVTGPAPDAVPVIEHRGPVRTIAFSPDGRFIASGSDDHVTSLYDTVSGRPALTLPHADPVWVTRFGADGRSLATGGGDGTVRLWNLTRPVLPGDRTVSSVAFGPDDRLLATGNTNGAALLWDSTHPLRITPTGALPPAHTGAVTALAFSPLGTVLATGGADGLVHLWDVTTPDEIRPIGSPLAGHQAGVTTVTFNGDGSRLASVAADATVLLWDLTDPAESTMAARRPGVAAAFSPDQDILAVAGSDGTLTMWDTGDLRKLSTVDSVSTGHGDAITGLSFGPGGRLLATASADRTIRLWDTADARDVAPYGQPLSGHTGVISAVRFTADGATLLSVSQDGSLRIWDVRQPDTISPEAFLFADITLDALTALAVHGDQHTVAITTVTGAAVVVDIDAERVADRICASAGTPMTYQEWAQYFPDLPHRPTCP